MRRSLLFTCIFLLGAAMLIACQGPEGAEGPPGPAGQQGLQGVAADLSEVVFGAEYAGSETCEECHTEIYATFTQSGHPYKLNPVIDGKPPTYPFTEVPNPPEGYTWDDITYVIGGYNWKARFIGLDGFIITGDENATTQYNLYNDNLDMGMNWVGYHAGEEKPYTCGTCHTTGYNPEGHQDGLEGLVGTWSEPGVWCEECHGPASLHNENPYGVALKVDRDAEACGDCHQRGQLEVVDASKGFIRHHEQYEELYQSKHLALKCVDCHDPHAGVVQLREAGEQTTRTTCDACHFKQGQNAGVEKHLGNYPACIDCHMPLLTKSALGDASRFMGDVRTHLMAIDPLQVGQFTEDGGASLSQLSLDFSCRGCHNGVDGDDLSDETLIEAATGYHE